MFNRNRNTETEPEPKNKATRKFSAHYPMNYFGEVFQYPDSSHYWRITLIQGPKPYPALGSGTGATFAEVHQTMTATMQLWIGYGHPHIESKN